MEDLTTIIEDSLTDATLPEAPSEPTETPEVEAAPSLSEPTEVAPESPEAPAEPTSSLEVASPAAAKPVDDFDKKHGLTPATPGGRENRIPYTRVKKIADNAVKEAKTGWQKELETSYVPVAKYQETEAKVKDYESKLAAVVEFERVMTTEQPRFLDMLSKLPGYAELLTPKQAQAPLAQAPVVAEDDFPKPDQELSDGSMVYSMEGLKALREWDRKQVSASVLKEVEDRYAPLEKDYQSYQQVQQVLPAVNAQIAEARTWALFNESEAEVVAALQANPRWSLERAYQHVVVPKLQADRDKMRADLLKEVKQAPRSTSAPTSAAKAAPITSNGPRSLEDIIAEATKSLK